MMHFESVKMTSDKSWHSIVENIRFFSITNYTFKGQILLGHVVQKINYFSAISKVGDWGGWQIVSSYLILRFKDKKDHPIARYYHFNESYWARFRIWTRKYNETTVKNNFPSHLLNILANDFNDMLLLAWQNDDHVKSHLLWLSSRLI